MASNNCVAQCSYALSSFKGTATVPGDKSISHRALMLASQALGTTRIHGLLLGQDVIHTAEALKKLGVTITIDEHQSWHVQGVGIGGLVESDDMIDMGNTGTGTRLMMGLVATHPFITFFTGDKSLRSRPMGRIATPLRSMGASIVARSQERLPLAVTGSRMPVPITYSLPVPSAQIKSALLLAALNTPGKTTIIEPEATRDHTELMLQGMGITLEIERLANNAKSISITGQEFQPKAHDITIPGDPSSAAFLVVAALLAPEGELLLNNICINPHRIGLYTTLIEMGASIQFKDMRQVGGEQVADIYVKNSVLKGVSIPAERAPSMIDEYPILAVASACAEGDTIMQGLAELKVKESNRLQAIAEGLKACGVSIEEGDDSLIIHGQGKKPQGGSKVTTYMDHRIAMSFLILGTVTKEPVMVDDTQMIETSFPGFIALCNRLGARMRPPATTTVI